MHRSAQTIRLMLTAALTVLVIPVILAAGLFTGGRYYALMSTAIVVLAMLPFFLVFEKRRPKARELVPIAVMAAIAAVSRLAFAALPQFKPILAVVIITALAFGPEAGFLTGAVAMLASNVFFGQGPWTPWQMYCCGAVGFLAGALRQSGRLQRRWSLCLFGLLSGYLYGFIMDFWTVSSFGGLPTWAALVTAWSTGLYFDTILAVATAAFLLLLAGPIERKLTRLRRKFGLMAQL